MGIELWPQWPTDSEIQDAAEGRGKESPEEARERVLEALRSSGEAADRRATAGLTGAGLTLAAGSISVANDVIGWLALALVGVAAVIGILVALNTLSIGIGPLLRPPSAQELRVAGDDHKRKLISGHIALYLAALALTSLTVVVAVSSI